MKAVFCTTCQQEQPTTKQVLRPMMRAGKVIGRKVRICIVCRKPVLQDNKRNAKPAMGTTGRMRHSSSEAAYEGLLAWQQKLGEIEDLRLCNDPPREVYQLDVFSSPIVVRLLEFIEARPDGERMLHWLAADVRRSLAPIGSYTPDFSYRRKGEQQRRVVDTKGYADSNFSRTRKLMRACHGVDVEVVKVPREVLKNFGGRAA